MEEGEYVVESLHVLANVDGAARALDLSETPARIGRLDGGEHSIAERGVLTLAANGACELALAISVDGQAPGISDRACSWSVEGGSLILGAADGAPGRYTITKNDNRYTLDGVVGSGVGGEPDGRANGERLILTRGPAAAPSAADGEAAVRADAAAAELEANEI